jgi:hypothetical protein
MNLDNMVTNFIQELFHTDKRVINNYGSNPSDRDYLLTRKNWKNYHNIYLYKTNNILQHTDGICEHITYNGVPLTFKMIKRYYGVA